MLEKRDPSEEGIDVSWWKMIAVRAKTCTNCGSERLVLDIFCGLEASCEKNKEAESLGHRRTTLVLSCDVIYGSQ